MDLNKKIIAWLKRNKINYSIKDNKIVLFNDANGSVELVFNYDSITPKAPRGCLIPSSAADGSDFYVKIGDWGKWINTFIDWAKERSYHECNNYHCAQWGTWKFDNFISFSFLTVFLKKAIIMRNSTQIGESMELNEALDILEKAGFLVETNKRSAAFYYRSKVFEKIQQIFDERAALARKTNPNVKGFKVDTLKSYIRAYGYQDLNKLINGEFEAGVSVQEAAEKCIDWFKDIVEREG